jgi:hypothetical protein
MAFLSLLRLYQGNPAPELFGLHRLAPGKAEPVCLTLYGLHANSLSHQLFSSRTDEKIFSEYGKTTGFYFSGDSPLPSVLIMAVNQKILSLPTNSNINMIIQRR